MTTYSGVARGGPADGRVISVDVPRVAVPIQAGRGFAPYYYVWNETNRSWTPEARVANVSLNLEETGILCHLLMGLLHQGDKETISSLRPYYLRMRALHEKLSIANEELMR